MEDTGMAEISTLLWDVGGVLLTNGWDHIERGAVLQHFGLDFDLIEPRHQFANDAWEKGQMTGSQYLDHTIFFEPRAFTHDEFLAQMKRRSVLLPHGAMRILQDLAASEELELVMFNNEARELNDYRIDQFELGSCFDVFLSSCYVGLRKPDPKFYELALDVLQRDADEVAFIDDRQHNCEAAAALGIHAIHYQDEAQCVRALEPLGIRTGVRT
jgi:putative hydrolase of the HAD superfamily